MLGFGKLKRLPEGLSLAARTKSTFDRGRQARSPSSTDFGPHILKGLGVNGNGHALLHAAHRTLPV